MTDFIIENSKLIKYQGPGGVVIIPDTVTELYLQWGVEIWNNTNITSITLPSSVIRIDKNAFKAAGNYTVNIEGKGKNLTGNKKYTVEIVNKIPMTKCKIGMPSVFDPEYFYKKAAPLHQRKTEPKN